MEEYIYSLMDIESAIYEALKDVLSWDRNSIADLIVDTTRTNLKKYVNVYRFYGRNCIGCIADNAECDFTYGRGKAKGAWEQAVKGELFDCPVRVNGTMIFNREEGLKEIDISDRDQPPYPIVEREGEIK